MKARLKLNMKYLISISTGTKENGILRTATHTPICMHTTVFRGNEIWQPQRKTTGEKIINVLLLFFFSLCPKKTPKRFIPTILLNNESNIERADGYYF